MPALLAEGLSGDVFLGVLLFVLMLAAMLVLLFFLQRRGGFAGGKRVKVIERVSITRDTALVVLRVGARCLVVCAGKDGGNLLCELSPDEIEASAAREEREEPRPPGFFKRFWHNLRLNLGLLPKGTRPLTPRAAPPPAEPESFAALMRNLRQQQDAAPPPPEPPAPEPPPKPPAPAPARPSARERPLIEKDYRSALDDMRRNARLTTSIPAVSPAPEAAGELFTRGEAGEFTDDKIDALLDAIAKRRARYTSREEQGGSS
jgi:flagellar biogenesis protein FliO